MRLIKKLTIFSASFVLIFAGLAVNAAAQEKEMKSDRPVAVRYYWVPDPFWHSRWYDPFYDNRYSYYDPYLQYRREKFSKQDKVREEAEELQEERRKARRDGVISADEREDINEERAEYLKARDELDEFYAEHRMIDPDGVD